MTIIQGGVVIQEGVPRSVNPFGRIREVRRDEVIQTAITAAAIGDIIYIEGKEDADFAEALTITKSNLTLVGIGGRGSVSVKPGGNGVALTVDGTAARRGNITLINLGLEGSGTGGGLLVKGNTRRIRAYGCKLEGGAFAAKLESTGANPLTVGDVIFDDCELAWAQRLLDLVVSGAGDPVTNIQLKRCLLHNMSIDGIRAAGAHTAGFQMSDCVMDREEDGTAPTGKYIDIAVAGSSGIITGCSFPHATNASAVFAIAAGVLWVANATEAGVTTARPS